jgi:hypothetical protein
VITAQENVIMKTSIRLAKVTLPAMTAMLALAGFAWSFNPPSPIPATQPIAAGQQVIQRFDSLGNTWIYAAYVPPQYDVQPTRKWPVILYFGVIGTTYPNAPVANLTTNNYGPARYLADNAAYAHAFSDSFIVLTPWFTSDVNPCWTLAVNNTNFWGYCDPWLKHVLGPSLRIDTMRIHAMGYCYGAGVLYKLFVKYPNIPASMSLFSPGDPQGACILDTGSAKACLFKDMPMQWFHNTGDPYSPYQVSQTTVNAIKACGNTKIIFTLGTSTIHESWGRPGSGWPTPDTVKAYYDWMLAQKKSGATSVASNPASNKAEAVGTKELPQQLLSTRLGSGDRMEIAGIDGKQVYRCNGSGLTVQQMLPRLSKQVYLVRLTTGKESVSRLLMAK